MQLPIDYDSASPKKRREAREEYVKLQKGLCCFCNYPLSEPMIDSVKTKYPLEFDYKDDSVIVARWKSFKGKKIWVKATFPPGMLDSPVHLHHDHKTGLTIGATHDYSNIISYFVHGNWLGYPYHFLIRPYLSLRSFALPFGSVSTF
jgi:hypothetical protein